MQTVFRALLGAVVVGVFASVLYAGTMGGGTIGATTTSTSGLDAGAFEPTCGGISCVDAGVNISGALSLGAPGTGSNYTLTFNGSGATTTLVHKYDTGRLELSHDLLVKDEKKLCLETDCSDYITKANGDSYVQWGSNGYRAFFALASTLYASNLEVQGSLTNNQAAGFGCHVHVPVSQTCAVACSTGCLFGQNATGDDIVPCTTSLTAGVCICCH